MQTLCNLTQKKFKYFISDDLDTPKALALLWEIVKNPKESLKTLCERLSIKFYDSMLYWKPGKRNTDGVWEKYWYKNVKQSSSFMPLSQNVKNIPEKWKSIYSECVEIYEYLLSRKEATEVVSR